MCFFCFKQKTAYEMRISDWSSDVCSSDLIGDAAIAIPFDAGEPDTIASMVAQTAEHFGRIDVLHNNAALLDLAFLERDRTAVDTDIEVWDRTMRSEEHTSELQSLMRISYAVFCLKKKKETSKRL